MRTIRVWFLSFWSTENYHGFNLKEIKKEEWYEAEKKTKYAVKVKKMVTNSSANYNDKPVIKLNF